jgi:hypothetical protein
MAESANETDWKLKLRYGRLKTPYAHFTAIAEGVMRSAANPFECPEGSAFMGMKAWASSSGEAADMVSVIGKDIGFEVTGDVQIYDTEPEQPPRENPHGYDIKFTPFEREAKKNA